MDCLLQPELACSATRSSRANDTYCFSIDNNVGSRGGQSGAAAFEVAHDVPVGSVPLLQDGVPTMSAIAMPGRSLCWPGRAAIGKTRHSPASPGSAEVDPTETLPQGACFGRPASHGENAKASPAQAAMTFVVGAALVHIVATRWSWPTGAAVCSRNAASDGDE